MTSFFKSYQEGYFGIDHCNDHIFTLNYARRRLNYQRVSKFLCKIWTNHLYHDAFDKNVFRISYPPMVLLKHFDTKTSHNIQTHLDREKTELVVRRWTNYMKNYIGVLYVILQHCHLTTFIIIYISQIMILFFSCT